MSGVTVAQSVSMNAHGGVQKVGEGNKTQVIYTLIRDQKYAQVIRILNDEVRAHPRSRGALSLLGFCYYYLQDYAQAATTYEQLVRVAPGVEQYRVYRAQCLYHGAMYDDAMRAAMMVEDSQYRDRMLHLQAAIKYEQDALPATKSYVDQCIPDHPDTVVLSAAILYKEGQFEPAMKKFRDAMNSLGYQSDLAYNIALCFYKQKQYAQAMKHINEIIDQGVMLHPELSVGSSTPGYEVRSVGNSQTLKETALIEAFNLKAAIEYQLKNFDMARDALNDMPPRSEEELDPVTLQNQALMNMETDAEGGFQKLNFLLSQPPESIPPETFGNLLLLYCKYQYYDVAADVLAQNTHLHEPCLSKDLYDYLEATILTQSSPEEAYRKFDQLAQSHTTILRKLTKEVHDARCVMDNEKTKQALKEYDDALERYVPVLMAQAKIYWDIENYIMVERIFKQSAEFASEHTTWKLNVAHVFFMQETKFPDAIRFYQPAIKEKRESDILDVTAIVLANLCVSYIMTNHNDEAEELMRQIEKEEERQSVESTKQSYHLCIVNLVIGTLYCAKGNFEFGVSRIIKSLEPYEKKLGVDTWFYAKCCFLALFEALAKHTMVAKDEFYKQILQFLSQAEEYGTDIITLVSTQGNEVDPAVHNVAYEARQLKRMFLKLGD